jgi:hypothetical protein
MTSVHTQYDEQTIIGMDVDDVSDTLPSRSEILLLWDSADFTA